MPADRGGNRSKNYKAGINTDASHRRREETTVQLRRNKREDSLMKRRKDRTTEMGSSAPFDAAEQAMEQQAGQAMPQQANLHDIQEMVQAVLTEDRAAQLEATTRFRKLLSIGTNHLSEPVLLTCFIAERNPPIQEVIGAGVVPRFIQFLKCYDNPQLQVAYLACHALDS